MKEIIRRLSFIKYLYNFAIEQSYKPEPLNAVSLLIFHDALDLFAQIAIEKVDNVVIDNYINNKKTKRDRLYLMDYLEILGINSHAMIRINTARNSLKHVSNLPNKIDIESFRASITAFFEENILKIFDIEFSELSLIDLIQYEPSKNKLKEAQQLVKEDKIDEALKKVALSFSQLIRDYEGKKSIFGESPFSFRNKIRSSDVSGIGIDLKKYVAAKKFFNSIIDSIESMQGVLKLLSLGIDYKKYAKFDLFTPKVRWTLAGKPDFVPKGHVKSAIPNIEDVEYCINFVIETAMLLQNIDYELERDGYTHLIKRDH